MVALDVFDDGLDRAAPSPPPENAPRLPFPEPVHGLHVAVAIVAVSPVSEVAVGVLQLHLADVLHLR